MTAPAPPRIAVLRDYPVRLWAEQQQYTQELLRDFRLLLLSDDAGEASAPADLVALAETFSAQFGEVLDEIYAERQEALDAGADRVDSHVPLVVDDLGALLARVDDVLRRVDEHCARGSLLTLPRPPVFVRLFEWTRDELVAQADGAEPRPWPGPF